jgi:hypothetical protein
MAKRKRGRPLKINPRKWMLRINVTEAEYDLAMHLASLHGSAFAEWAREKLGIVIDKGT